MKKQFRRVTVALLVVFSCGLLSLFSGCVKEIPWWKDRENLQIILEDERSKEKSITISPSTDEKIFFTYTFDVSDTKEYIPNVKILHRGVNKEVYTWVYNREWFYNTPNGYDYEDPHVSAIIKDPGAYRVYLEFRINEEGGSALTNYIDGASVYVIINEEAAQ